MSKRKTPIVLGNARFTVFTAGCIRMEYAKDGQFSPHPSVLTGGQKVKALSADVEMNERSLTLRTDRLVLRYTDTGENFSPANLRIEHKNIAGGTEHWVPGKRDDGNLGTVKRSLDSWTWCGGPGAYPVEGILSRQGGHFLPDEPRVYWNPKTEWIENRSRSVWYDGYFFAYGNDFKGALRDFVHVFGPIPMVPRWTFGFWYSRWFAYKDSEFVELAKKYRKSGIPIDVMIIDTDWRDGWGGYDWSKKYFPKPERALKQLHDLGLITSLNDHPGYDGYEALPDNDSHIPGIEKALGPRPHNGDWACDWSNKRALDHWKKHVLGPFFDQGMDFWWVDGWIKSPSNGLDSQLWANKHYYELAEEKTGKRGMILSRWGGIGSHRYPVQFSGDTHSNWHTLKHQIEFTARSGNLGAAYWSHDIGGFHEKEIDEEIFIRWFQFGSLSPVFRTHSAFGVREPWKFSSRCQRLFRKQTHMRYALAPLFYGLAREAHLEGLPICRPMYLDNNENDGGALDRKHQYMLGSDLLVIPADGRIDKNTGVQRKRAYFPKGTWRALETNDVRIGYHDAIVEIPLDTIPVYVREGAILPSQAVGDRLGTQPPEEIHFDFFPTEGIISRYDLYEDDGESLDHQSGKYAVTRVSGLVDIDCFTLDIEASEGSYKGMPKQRTYVVRCALQDGEKVKTALVTVGKESPLEMKVRTVKTCLAGTVKTPYRFAEVTVTSRNKPVRIEWIIE